MSITPLARVRVVFPIDCLPVVAHLVVLREFGQIAAACREAREKTMGVRAELLAALRRLRIARIVVDSYVETNAEERSRWGRYKAALDIAYRHHDGPTAWRLFTCACQAYYGQVRFRCNGKITELFRRYRVGNTWTQAEAEEWHRPAYWVRWRVGEMVDRSRRAAEEGPPLLRAFPVDYLPVLARSKDYDKQERAPDISSHHLFGPGRGRAISLAEP